MPTKDIIERAMNIVSPYFESVLIEALRTQRQEIITELKGMNHSMGDNWKCITCLSNEEWRTMRDNLIKKLEE